MNLENILPKDGPPITEVKKYIEKYKNDLIVIKYGGNVLIDRNVFNNFITDLSVLNKLGLATVVIHGGGPRIKRELEKSNIQSKFIRGLRVTDKNIIDIVESVLIDRNVFNNFITDLSVLNKLGLATVVIHGGGPRIKRELEKSNIQSKFIRGLRVTDKNIIDIVESVLIDFNDDIVNSLKDKGTEAISIHTKNNNIIKTIPEAEELGFVGIPNEINNEQILNIINQNKIPIISPLGLGKENQTYNINGDTAAMAIAKSLKSRRLLLMTNVDGVLDKNKKLIEEISSSEVLEMIKDETITEGMIPKINACLDAVNNGVTAVGIINGTKPHSCLWEIFSDKGSGTLIRQ